MLWPHEFLQDFGLRRDSAFAGLDTEWIIAPPLAGRPVGPAAPEFGVLDALQHGSQVGEAWFGGRNAEFTQE